MAKRKTPPTSIVSEPQAEYMRLRARRGRATPKGRTAPAPLSDEALVELVSKPLPKQRVRAFLGSGLLDEALLGKVLGISKAQVALRLRGTGSLVPAESERVRLAEQVLNRGTEVFGDEGKFARWLRSPIGALGNQRPLDLMTSIIGMRIVADELETIAHGVFA